MLADIQSLDILHGRFVNTLDTFKE